MNENTVIKIERAGASVEVSDTDIAFNTVKKETSSLPKGQEKVETEGANGVMETTNLVTKSGGKVMSSNMISSFVKKAPTDKVILVQTQLKWFWGYCAQRYGSIQGAYTYWLANHCY